MDKSVCHHAQELSIEDFILCYGRGPNKIKTERKEMIPVTVVGMPTSVRSHTIVLVPLPVLQSGIHIDMDVMKALMLMFGCPLLNIY